MLEIPQAAPIFPSTSGEAKPQLQLDHRHRPTGLCSLRTGSSHKGLSSPNCELISHAQPCHTLRFPAQLREKVPKTAR